MSESFGPFVGVIEYSGNFVRFLIYVAQSGQLLTYHQIEVNKIQPEDGWIEQDPIQIIDSVLECIEVVVQKLGQVNIDVTKIKCIGITNERESIVVWDKITGKPLYNCIHGLDNRTGDLIEHMMDDIPGRDINWLKKRTGLPISTYFSAAKLKWLIDNKPDIRTAIKEERLLFGTVDTWILWSLTGQHRTDVTNASRTQLMDIQSCVWEQYLLDFWGIPVNILPEIKSSSDFFGTLTTSALKGVPITGVISDQSAALVGQQCFGQGQTNLTCGTGCNIIQNIGERSLRTALKDIPKESKKQLLTTIAYKLGSNAVCYALEGNVGIAGAAITWLRDNMELVDNYADLESIAQMQESSQGVYFVPAFNGLYAPYWDPNATGIILGFTQFSRKSHLIRATLDSIAYQANDILALMRPDINGVKIDGIISYSNVLCQTLADITGAVFVRPNITDTVALGAAMVAGYHSGVWDICGKPEPNYNCDIEKPLISSTDSVIKSNINSNNNQIFGDKYPDIFVPKLAIDIRCARIDMWRSAVVRCQKWVRVDKQVQKLEDYRRWSSLPFMLFALLSFGTHIVSQSCTTVPINHLF